jgi:hypothetical protein
MQRDPLVDKWFHSWSVKEDGCKLIEWQGHVLGKVDTEHYLVELHEWIAGEGNGQHLFTVPEMKDWTFYDTAFEMNNHYREYSEQKTWERHREHEAMVDA